MSLSTKRLAFVREYLKDGNATQAAIRAGYSKRSADVLGPRIANTPEVAAEIAKRRERIAERAELSVEKLDRKLSLLLDFDPRRMLDDKNNLKPPSEWDDATAAAVSGLDVEELFEGRGDDREQVGNVRKVKIADRIKPIELGYKRLGVLREQAAFQVGALTIVIQE